MVNRFHLVSDQIRKDEELKEYWGYYTDDVIEIFGYGDGINELLTKYKEQIIDSVDYWNREENRSSLIYLFDIYLQICKAYNIKAL